MDIDRLLKAMVDQEASDLFLKVGHQPFVRLHGKLLPAGTQRLAGEEVLAVASELMGPHRRQLFYANRDLSFSFDRAGIGRFRASVLWQRDTVALVIRRVQSTAKTFEELELPGDVLKRWLSEPRGLLLVTGPAGSGKSTTVAAMLQWINQTTAKHIVTLEDPIESRFEDDRSIINQREIGSDTRSFAEGLKHVLRQSPDVLYVSDIRDRETMEAALLAAEAGQLVIGCIHTTNAVTTVERIAAFFPSHQHQIIRLRVSLALQGILSLRLLTRRDGERRVPVCEVLAATPTIRELIREGHTEQLTALMHDGHLEGMQTFTQALYARYRHGEIDLEEALRHADSPEELHLAIRQIRATKDLRA